MCVCDSLGLLNDNTSYNDSFITKLDPRIKFVFSFIFLFVIISTKNILVPIAILVFMVAGLISLKINRNIFLIRGLPALLIAATILITQIFLYGKTPLFEIKMLGFQILGYREGFVRGIILMCRVLAGISTLLFLTMSTSINKLIFAAKWFHIPNAFLEVLTITYRYIFVLFDEMSSVKNAQKIRLGFSSYNKSMKSFGSISGIIILRAIDKSEKLYKAMKSRGYNGQQIKVYYEAKFMKNDWIVTVSLSITVVVMIIVSF